MKLVFVVAEKIMDEVEYSINVPDNLSEEKLDALREEIEEHVSDFEDYGDSDDLEIMLSNEYGIENVSMKKGGIQNMYPANYCEFQEWVTE